MANKTIRVFFCTSFPENIRVVKIDLYIQLIGNRFMNSRFSPVNTCNRMNWNIFEKSDDHLLNSFFGMSGNQSHALIEVLSVYRGYDSILLAIADDRTHFTVSQLASGFLHLWAFIKYDSA